MTPTPKPLADTQKMYTWIVMLLAWNIALLSIAGFSLYRLTVNSPSAEDIAALCAEAMSVPTP